MTQVAKSTEHRRKPEWLRVRLPGGERYQKIRSQLRALSICIPCAKRLAALTSVNAGPKGLQLS